MTNLIFKIISFFENTPISLAVDVILVFTIIYFMFDSFKKKKTIILLMKYIKVLEKENPMVDTDAQGDL